MGLFHVYAVDWWKSNFDISSVNSSAFSKKFVRLSANDPIEFDNLQLLTVQWMYFDALVSVEIDVKARKNCFSAVSIYVNFDACFSSSTMLVEEDQMNRLDMYPYWIDENLDDRWDDQKCSKKVWRFTRTTSWLVSIDFSLVVSFACRRRKWISWLGKKRPVKFSFSLSFACWHSSVWDRIFTYKGFPGLQSLNRSIVLMMMLMKLILKKKRKKNNWKILFALIVWSNLVLHHRRRHLMIVNDFLPLY